jgi:uncharacterized protein
MRIRTWLVVALGVLAVLLLAGRAATALVVDHAWYDAMSVPWVFWEQFLDTVLLQGGTWLLGSIFAFANLHAVRRTIRAVAVPSRVANIEVTAMLPPRRLLSITIVLAALIGFALALPLTDWTSVAMVRHGVPFGEIEGMLDRDLGFYVYVLPLEETLYLWSLATLVLVVTLVTLLYALTRSLRMDGRRIVASTHVRRHLSVLGAIVLLLLAWSYRLDSFDLLQRGSGPNGLFLRMDHVVVLPVDRVLVILCAIAAPIFLRAGWSGQVRSAFVTLSLVLTAAIGGRHLLPIALSRSTLVGDPSRRDQPYLANRTLVSRRAYDVDGIRLASPDSGSAPHTAVRTRMSLSSIASRVSLWDPEATRARNVDGRSVQVDAGATGWVRTSSGDIGALLVRRPVAGVERWSISIANATLPMLRDSVLDFAPGLRDDGSGEEGEPIAAPGLYTPRLVRDPAGVMGTPLRGLGMRVAQAWANRDPALLEADTMTGAAPRLVTYRDVRQRVMRLAPVLVQGEEVQPILHDNALLWAVSLYSASAHYPLSQRWMLAGGERSYFRLAATALVDATTGRVRFIPVERVDPIARSWFAKIPALMVNARDLPAGLLDQLPPASDGAIAQLRTFARYGSRLDGAIARQPPDSLFNGATPPIHLVGSALGAVSAWSVPLLSNGDDIDGVITAVGGRYRGTYWDAAARPRLRWSVQAERLRSALDSARAALPDGSRREPRARFGRVHVVAGDETPVLLQSLLSVRADGSTIVSRVAVLDGARLAMGGTAGEALAALRGQPTTARDAAWPLPGGAERDARLTSLYDAMREALRRGEWTRFGAAFDSLGTLLGKPPQ